MKKLSLIIHLGFLLNIAAPMVAMEQQPVPVFEAMSDEEVYNDPLAFFYDAWGTDETAPKMKAAQAIAEVNAVKAMRSVIEKSEMEAKAKESLLKALDKKIARFEQLLNQKKQDLASKRTYRKVMFGLQLVAPVVTTLLVLGVLAAFSR